MSRSVRIDGAEQVVVRLLLKQFGALHLKLDKIKARVSQSGGGVKLPSKI
jgi:hypothetical protein